MTEPKVRQSFILVNTFIADFYYFLSKPLILKFYNFC